MNAPEATDVKRGISALWEALQCPICLDLMTTPVSTRCDHQFCKFCMFKLLDNSKQNQASCPVCKAKITKRSLQESPGFQRLVAGLQDMVTAYEHDTATNYFTATDQPRGQIKVTDEAVERQQETMSGGCPEAESPEHPVDDLPKSHSSTIAAMNGFADLMDFGETSPSTRENDGLDSGLGEAPPTSQKKTTEVVEVTETATAPPHEMGASLLAEESMQPPGKPDDPRAQTVRRLSRKRSKKELKTSKILDEKQKRSVEKVAEWLMKVPTEGSLELEHLNNADEDSDSCSSSSTIDVRPQNNVPQQSKRGQSRALEDQVFGAVYRRERKSPRAVFPVLDPLNKPDQEGSQSVSTENSGRNAEERLEAAEEKEANSGAVLGEEPTVEDDGGQTAEHEEAPDRRQALVRKTKTRTRSSVRQVDSDLLQRAEETTQIPQTRNKKRSQNLRSEKVKPVSGTKPLELVPVQSEEPGPPARPRSQDVQVHIENYPSSEDQELPSKRSTRSSRRLQVFTERIRDGRRNAKSKVDSEQKETDVSEQPNETGGKSLDGKRLQNPGPAAKDPERNGCVCNEDLGGIEDMDTGGTPQGKGKDSISEVANTGSFPERSSAGDPAMLSPSEVGISPTHHPPNSTQQDAADCESPQAGGVEEEEEQEEQEEQERNDSELDTEQLLRSFKGTKRKSFHLGGGPSVKRSRSGDETEVRRRDDDSLDVLGGGEEVRVRATPQALQGSGLDQENSSAGVISPSISPRRAGNPLLEEPHQEAACVDSLPSDSLGPDATGAKSASSPLPPNIQSKRCDGDSTSPSVKPRVGESGLYFVSVEQGHLHAHLDRPQRDSQPDQTDERNPSHSGQLSAEHEESSLTPDGLGMSAGGNSSQQEAKRLRSSCSGEELSGLSPVKSAARKRSRRLQSTSESSDCSGGGDGLPTLAEIFGGSAPAGPPEQGAGSGPGRRQEDVEEELSQEVQSSQASVDLFGTPEEGEAAANEPCASAESSQLSSDVLVTQQKLEMQKELVRLEKLMALVSEVLQEKEGSPVREAPPRMEHSCRVTDSSHELRPEHQETTCERTPVPESGTRSSEVKDLQQVTGSKPGGPAEPTPRPAHHRPSVKDPAACRNDEENKESKENKENNSPAGDRSRAKTVLVSSGLDPHQQILVKKFAKQVGARVASKVTEETTHVVMHTDDQLVCERTLKYFLGIAGRKWVVSFQWISECFKQKKLLAESPFEVRGDVVNGCSHQGPRRARTTDHANLLMKDLRICFQGTFTDMTTDEMQWMVELCGAAVVKDPLLLDVKQKSQQLVVVQPGAESWSTHSALSRRATLVTRGWLLDSVATYSLQDCSKYKAEQRIQ